MPTAPAQHRAHFDFTISFANGGGMSGEGFRLDLPRADIGESELGRLLVRHLGLALVSEVELRGLRIVEEAHRGSRGADAPSPGPARVIDLSHPLDTGLITSPGGIGTSLDSPLRGRAGGGGPAAPDLSSLVGIPAEVFHLRDSWTSERRGIDAVTLADRELAGAAVLLDTGWSSRFGSPEYAVGAPFLTVEGARFLADADVRIVGIDSAGIDEVESAGDRPARSILLAAGVHVVEHLTGLHEVPARGARFTAAPPAVRGSGVLPVRAFATVESSH